MKQFVIAALMLGAAASAHAVDAAKAQEIANKNACMGCHQVDKKLVGPAYKDVAAKYKGDKNAVATLVKKVKTGGSGVWGPVPMPANTGLSDAEAKTVVEWVLAGSPAK
ncbi:c-type cytochrome [Cupriavidus sp. WKF15]|uniref:c-type cytochrome n=1 Tax=Cupriavidus sp. WKF15 TaxID=3032282 RepID=UPI0023E2B66F|nr:c-type cytochrome [Cupriavidus sp. WKF15]WER45840.1 c-type cytochrome [Cupriavidus sp. WKF15]